MAVILFTVFIVFSPYILKNIISSPHIYDAAESYIHWRVYGFFFSFIMVMFRAFFVGTTQTKTLTLNSIVMVLSNVVFNYILIFGKFGFPQLGIAGAAIGSSLAEMVSVIFFIIYTWKRIDCRKYALNILPKFQGKTLKRILNVSVWTMIQNFVSLSTWFMFFLFVEHLGERSLAIANIIRNVSGIPFMIAMAFASTCGSLVSNLIGAGEQDCVRGTIRQHIRIGYIFVLPILIFFCLFPDLILRIYTDMPDLRAASVPSLWVLCSAYLVLGIIPPNVFTNPVYALVATITSCVVFLAFYWKRQLLEGHMRLTYDRVMLVMDSIGLGIFTVVGVNTGIRSGYMDNVFLLVFLGTITGVGGGLMRDMMAGVPPYIFVKHIYACASIVGAVVCVYMNRFVGNVEAMMVACFVIILIRYLAAHYRWNLPRLHNGSEQ